MQALNQEIIASFRSLVPDIRARLRSQGFQVTVLQNCDSIYLAAPCIFDTRTGIKILRKLDEFFNRITPR